MLGRDRWACGVLQWEAPWGSLPPLTLPFEDVAFLGDLRLPLRGEFLGVTFRLAPRRKRLFPSFFGVFRMLKASE